MSHENMHYLLHKHKHYSVIAMAISKTSNEDIEVEETNYTHSDFPDLLVPVFQEERSHHCRLVLHIEVS